MPSIATTKTIKKSAVKTPVQQLQDLKTALTKQQQQLAPAYEKATAFVQKQLGQLKSQLAVAKKKLTATQSKAKPAKVGSKNSPKKVGASLLEKLEKSKVAIHALQTDIKKTTSDISTHQATLVNLKQDQKQFLSYVKVQQRFAKEWTKKAALASRATRAPSKKAAKPVSQSSAKKTNERRGKSVADTKGGLTRDLDLPKESV